jgi:sulfatase maturation enzyme AslB (radical SAM superfamily)
MMHGPLNVKQALSLHVIYIMHATEKYKKKKKKVKAFIQTNKILIMPTGTSYFLKGGTTLLT